MCCAPERLSAFRPSLARCFPCSRCRPPGPGLRLLDERGVRAAFFPLGSEAHRSPGPVREMAAAGHEIAIHG
ncbi:polysaccharide deacetylase family protein [Streptomyces sp. NPDC058294]|uniref:polysaccharide deacetylase family protein n=1 Tax=Streptomyces sp. NPDC058294 TaxID=3346430 RepID=UPI0036E21DD6